MVLANHTLCGPSTFCLFPTLGTHGMGYIVDTSLYPWVKHVHSRPVLEHIRVLYTPFLSQARITRSGMDIKAIIACLRADGACGDLAYQNRTRPVDWNGDGTWEAEQREGEGDRTATGAPLSHGTG